MCYACESWVLKESSENESLKENCCVFGPAKDNRTWRIRYNQETMDRHMVRMLDMRLPKRSFDSEMQGRRPNGRRQKWGGGDARIL